MALIAAAVTLLLLTTLAAALELGYRLEQRARRITEGGTDSSLGAIEGAVFAILGLILAFSFSVAATRFDARRHLTVDEANAIGTAQLRIDLLPKEGQPRMRALFADYIGSRIEFGRGLSGLGDAEAAWAKTQRLQQEIWQQALAAPPNLNGTATPVQALLLPALNQMFDLSASRRIASKTQLPLMTLGLLLALSILGAYLAGRTTAPSKHRSFTHRLLYPVVITITLVVIVDLDHPRLGLIRSDYTDELLHSLLTTDPRTATKSDR